jgi:hypothetical protein
MDIVSKIFLINLTLVITLVLIDIFMLEDKLEDFKCYFMWVGVTVISIPLYVIYAILVW